MAARLDRQTLESLALAGSRTAADFVLVPEDSETPSNASAVPSLADSLPQVWQDLFVSARVAQSSEFLDRLACSAPADAPRPAPSKPGTAGSTGHRDDPGLGISRDTVFTQFLSPEALVQQHRLGKPQVRRLYQALQVYTLGFHQMCVELTAHATNRGLLLLAVWRAFAMLWDGALQVVFPSETVQASRERQAALLMSEQMLEQLHAAEARSAQLAQENAALHAQVQSMAVQVLSAQADVAVAQQGTSAVEKQLRAARQEAASSAAQADAGRMDLLRMQDKLAALQGPQEVLYTRAEQLERLLKDKQAQLSAAAKQAAEALAGKEEAKQAARAERLAREAAERRTDELQAELSHTNEQRKVATAAAADAEAAAVAEAAGWKQHEAAEAAAREDDTARIATERAGWQRAATEGEAAAAGLRQQLAAAEAALQQEKMRCAELVASLWPLTAKVKALEAAAAARMAGTGHEGAAGSVVAAAAEGSAA